MRRKSIAFLIAVSLVFTLFPACAPGGAPGDESIPVTAQDGAEADAPAAEMPEQEQTPAKTPVQPQNAENMENAGASMPPEKSGQEAEAGPDQADGASKPSVSGPTAPEPSDPGAADHKEHPEDVLPMGEQQPQQPEPTPDSPACTLSISCATVLDHLEDLDPDKTELVPDAGTILAPVEVSFSEGESVLDVLKRETRARKIHMEFVNTPLYNTAYIEGIANLYEFDCGELSGWMYRVNGEFPNVGCSLYKLKDGDAVEWVYTCDLGRDVGGEDVSQRGGE